MSDNASTTEEIRDEAIVWMVAIREGLRGDEQLEFERWLRGDPRHALAWRRLDASLSPFRILQSQNVSGRQLVSSINKTKMNRRVVIANSAKACIAFAGAAVIADRLTPLRGVSADFRTRTGERRNFLLPDRSALTLDARSDANLLFDAAQRGIQLRSGMAFMNIVAMPELFSIQVGETIASLTGGSLNVSLRNDECRIVCLGGEVAIEIYGTIVGVIGKNEGVSIFNGELRHLPSTETQDADSWISGNVILHDRSLRELVSAFQPYSVGWILVSEDAARLRVSGVFNLDRVQDLLSMIPELFPVRVLQVARLITRIELA